MQQATQLLGLLTQIWPNQQWAHAALVAERQHLCCWLHGFCQALRCLQVQVPALHLLAPLLQPYWHVLRLLQLLQLALHPTWPAARQLQQLLQ